MTTIIPPEIPQSYDPLRPAHVGHGQGDAPAMPRLIRSGAMLLALAAVFAFGAIIYSASQNTPSSDDVPVVAADSSPVRVRPDNAGGMEVANRDSTVFQGSAGAPQAGGLEQLVPAPEQPIVNAETAVDPQAPGAMPEPRRPDGSPALTADEIRAMHRPAQAAGGDAASQAVAQLETAANNVPPGVSAGHTSTVAERLEPLAPVDDTASAPVPLASAPVAAAAPVRSELEESSVPAVTEAPEPTSAPAPKAVAKAPTAAAVASVRPSAGAAIGGAKLVQLGAVRSEEAAKAEWQRLKAKFSSQLNGLSYSVQKADLGAKGVFWRVRAGSVSPDDGKKICDALKAAGQSCMVVAK